MRRIQLAASFTFAMIRDVKVCAIAIAVFLLVLSESAAWAQGKAKVGGYVPYHSGNLLQNPDASSPTVNPPWTSTGNWAVTTGPATLSCPVSMNSQNGPWFLETGALVALYPCSSCVGQRTVTLVQTVNVSAYSSIIWAYQTYIEYGGDAFAEGCTVGSGSGGGLYHASAGYQASYSVEFLNSSGNLIAPDTSGFIFPANYGCVFNQHTEQNYGYRRTVSGIPTATRYIRFTATMIDKASVCYNSSTTVTFKNGFDNLWLDFIFLGGPKRIGRFKEGPAPGPAVKVKLTPNRRSPNRRR